ncbi:universal stress protein [Cesiribacter andamanensis]|uniref:Universal stress protein family protein n=1 Tax=Cesiribacter andamanensis AMV16 TaxID=1279009 RepID=M7NNV2_9BACT|nr:universal stress protein [Cesiribacter andamanensis]EMR03400.1 Universal stress protein family protein [Cesiribacter andamanensis AMV16]
MKRLRNLLIPVDFTPHADNALRYAIALARSIPMTRLYILHTYHIPAAVTGAGAMAVAPYYESELRQSTEEKFQELEARMLKNCRVPYEFVGEYGPAVPDICEASARLEADLIILPAHPTNRLDEYFGNVTTATIRSSPVPVLVVPPHFEFRAPKQVVLATDCQNAQRKNWYQELRPWLSNFNPDLILLHTNEDPQHMEEEKALQLLVIKNQLTPYVKDFVVEEAKDPQKGITKWVEEHPADMLVVVPQEHSPLYHLLNKSVTHRLAFHTPIPMLVLV